MSKIFYNIFLQELYICTHVILLFISYNRSILSLLVLLLLLLKYLRIPWYGI